MWSFAKPQFLLFLFALPPLIFFRHFWKKRGGRLSFSFSVWDGEHFLPPQYLIRGVLLFSNVLMWLGFVALVLAMSGLSYIQRDKIYLDRGKDIMVVLDGSPSMAAQDFVPGNRFEVAKDIIREFIEDRSNDAIGLILYAREAVMISPPTVDYDYLVSRLNDLELMQLGEDTSVGNGIGLAALHLKESSARDQLIILISDGENNAGEISPHTAAQIAQNLGIRIHTVGVGQEGEVPISFVDSETGDNVTGVITSSFDEQLLMSLSELTGGQYFYARNRIRLQSAFNTIDSLEVNQSRAKVVTNETLYYQPLTLFGFFAVFGYLLIRKLILREVLI